MELEGKVVVVTGAAHGIGQALARRFHAEGAATVVVADLDGERARTVASDLEAIRPASALGIACDVAREVETKALIEQVRAQVGEIDLFFANAGIGLGTDLETTNEDWTRAWGVNWWSHLYAARELIPRWLERGEGYFCSTASAAGLLAQIGSAPYSVTKHAAVAFAEWLSITYGDRGIRVSCLCPMGVNTRMLGSSGLDPIGSTAGDVVRATSEVLEPAAVADVVVAGLRAETFLLLPHPDVLVHLGRKAADEDRWLAGMRRLQQKVQGG